MKFSAIFASVLASLAVGVSASPIANPNPAAVANADATPVAEPVFSIDEEESKELVTRATTVKTDAYQAAEKAHSSLAVGTYYVFQLEWDLPAAVDDAETQTELQKLQTRLGFEHVAVVAGVVTSKKTGRGKNEKTTLDFNAYFIDLIKKTDGSAELRGPTVLGKLKDKQSLKYIGTTTSKKGDRANLKKIGTAYFDNAAHKKYSTDNNHCATFKDAILLQLK